jgi:N-acetylmuramoyl-L-alanine amidase
MNYPTTATVTIGLALMTGIIPGPANARPTGTRTSQLIPPAKKLHRIRVRAWTGYKCRISPEMYQSPLAATLWMEARDQPETGQIAVAWTIKNRVLADKKRWGHGLLGVVTKYKQFSAHNCFKGRIDNNRKAFFQMLAQPEDSAAKRRWRRIQALSRGVWSSDIKNNIGKATFYATVSADPYWRYDMTVIGQIKDHVFFREQTKAEHAAYLADKRANAKLAKARRVARRANARAKHPKISITHRVKHVTLAARTHKR